MRNAREERVQEELRKIGELAWILKTSHGDDQAELWACNL